MGLKVSEQGGEGLRATGQSGMLPGLGRVWQQGRAGQGGAGRGRAGGGGNSSGLHVRAEAPVGFPGGNGVSVEPRAGEDDGAGDEAWEMDSVEPRACRRRPRRARGRGEARAHRGRLTMPAHPSRGAGE